MSFTREQKTRVLHQALDFPFQPSVLSLIRNLAHHFSMGTEADWGMANPQMQPTVTNLFLLLREKSNVSQP